MLNHARNFVQFVAVALVSGLVISPIEPVEATILHARETPITVQYHGSDLDTPQGVAGLYRRIRAAAQSVCGEPDDAQLRDKRLWNECVDRAVAGAVARVHSESLSAYREQQIHGRKRLVNAPESLAVREPR
jgi:UrcA family protein